MGRSEETEIICFACDDADDKRDFKLKLQSECWTIL